MQVDFMIIGAQKSGTTSLVYQLKQHPQICFCRHKEPHFFSKNNEWQTEISAYHQLFQPKPRQICGEASTSYTFCSEYPDTAERLHAYNPKLKLIYIMRHPVERIASHYRHRWVVHGLRAQPEDVVLDDPTYLERSQYAMQLRPYLKKFPINQIILLIFEEYIQQPHHILKQIADKFQISNADIDGIDISARNISKNRTLANKHRRYPRLKGMLNSIFPKGWQELSRRNQPPPPSFSLALKKQLWSDLRSEVEQVEHLLNRKVEKWTSYDN